VAPPLVVGAPPPTDLALPLVTDIGAVLFEVVPEELAPFKDFLPVGLEIQVEGHLGAKGADVQLVAMERKAEFSTKERATAAGEVLDDWVATRRGGPRRGSGWVQTGTRTIGTRTSEARTGTTCFGWRWFPFGSRSVSQRHHFQPSVTQPLSERT